MTTFSRRAASFVIVIAAVFGASLIALGLRSSDAEAQTFAFPAGGAYTLPAGTSTLAAEFKFAPPIQNITFGPFNLSTYVGNHFKNIAWIANRYGGGPAGKWDISDPWSPKQPEVIGLSYGTASDLGKGQPPAHRGPFPNNGWPHSGQFRGATFNDLPNGGARFVIAPNITLSRSISGVISFTEGMGLSLSQVFEQRWISLFEDPAHTDTVAVDATASGKFFLFGAGISAGDIRSYPGLQDQLYVFDITQSSGLTPRDPTLVATQAWQNVTEMKVIEVPGVRNHFLIARASASARAGVTDRPRFHIAEINADTGAIVRANSFTLDIAGAALPAGWSTGAVVLPGSNLDWASVGGNTYVFMSERLERTSPVAQAPGTLRIAAYRFDPEQLAFVRKGDISLRDFPGFNFADKDGAWNIARTENGGAYPLLVALQTAKTRLDAQGQPVPELLSQGLYSLKALIDSPTPLSLSPAAPDAAIASEVVTKPFTLGQAIVLGPDQNFDWGDQYHAFLRSEGGRTRLYFYRQARLFDGRQAGDPVFPYDERPSTGSESFIADSPGNTLPSTFRGPASMRIDRIDVSGLTGGAATTSTATSTPAGPLRIFTGAQCLARYRYLCDRVAELTRRICALVPGACERDPAMVQ